MATFYSTFVARPDLLYDLKKHVRSRKQLASLRLVNKAFADVFAPALFRSVSVGRRQKQSMQDVSLDLRKHIKELKCRPDYSDRFGYNSFVEYLLPELPALESFTWMGTNMYEGIQEALVRSCHRLKSVRVCYDRTDCNPSDRYMPDGPDLTELHGLEELAVEEMAMMSLNRNPEWWQKMLAQVLVRNAATLRKLSISFSGLMIFPYHSSVTYREKFLLFFSGLCEEYARLASTADAGGGPGPLHLESLKLGSGAFPTGVSSLQKLVDLQYLKEVHIDNTCPAQEHASTEPPVFFYSLHSLPGGGISFEPFGPPYAPNLTRLSVGLYWVDIHNHLMGMTDSSFARQLAVTARRQDYDNGFEPVVFMHLATKYPPPALHFRMMEIDLQRDMMNYSGFLNPTPPPARDVLENLVTDDNGTLEGLVLHLDEDDPLDMEMEGDPNVQLVDLDLVQAALPRLTGLQQLAIRRYPQYKSHMTGGSIIQVARTLAKVTPSLRYIEIYGHYFRIWRSDIDVTGHPWWIWAEDHDGVRLEGLEGEEIDDVELFRTSHWVPGI